MVVFLNFAGLLTCSWASSSWGKGCFSIICRMGALRSDHMRARAKYNSAKSASPASAVLGCSSSTPAHMEQR